MVGEQCPVVPSPSCPSKDERNAQTGGTKKRMSKGGMNEMHEQNAQTNHIISHHVTSCHVPTEVHTEVVWCPPNKSAHQEIKS